MIRIPRKTNDLPDQDELLPEGTYHVKIEKAEPGDENKLTLTYRLLGSTCLTAPLGQVFHQDFWTAGKEENWRLPITIILKRLGIVDRGTAEEDAFYDEQELVGKELITVIRSRTVKGKKSDYLVNDWPIGETWNVGHEKAPSVPMVRREQGTRTQSNGHAQTITRADVGQIPAGITSDDGF